MSSRQRRMTRAGRRPADIADSPGGAGDRHGASTAATGTGGATGQRRDRFESGTNRTRGPRMGRRRSHALRGSAGSRARQSGVGHTATRTRATPCPCRSRVTDDVQADPAASPLRPLTRPSIEQVKPAPRLTADEPPSMVVTPYPQTRVPIEPAAALDRAAPPPTVDARPLPHDEVIEVSIGAIHVRVDAPAPPAAAPAPPAPRAHVPASRPARDGLRRRALRRI